MANYFNSINVALRALQVQRKSLDVTSHNIANANTEGYSRQRVILTTTSPYSAPGFNAPTGAGQIGTGVEIEEIIRAKDEFITARLNEESQNLGFWESKKEYLSQIEMIFNEPSENGLRNLMDLFWTSWQELSKSPNSIGVRSAVKQQALTLIDAFQHTHQQLSELKADINHDISVMVAEINSIGKKIAELNKVITAVESDPSKNANDLRDQRDLLVKQLSEYINVTTNEDSQNSLNLSIGGIAFVTGENYHEISLVNNGVDSDKLVWGHIGKDVSLTSGKIKGAIEIRDNDIENYLSKLDELAAAIVTEVNRLHNSGTNPDTYDLDGNPGGDFFDPTKLTADTISLHPDIEASLNKIAAAKTDSIGDGENALAIAQLVDALTMNGGKSTFNEYFSSIISGLGVDAAKASLMTENQEVLVNNLENRQQSIAGVSLDEEMANMIKYQHAYNAAAKVVSVTDEILNTLINGMI